MQEEWGESKLLSQKDRGAYYQDPTAHHIIPEDVWTGSPAVKNKPSETVNTY